MRIIPSNTDFIQGYIYEIAGHQYLIDRQDIIHFKFPHPENDYFGLSPLQAAFAESRSTTSRPTSQKSRCKISASRRSSSRRPTYKRPDDAQRYATLFSQKWGGRNRGKIGVMQAGMDVKAVGLNMEELAFPELDAVSQKRVLVAIGVPPILLGQEATYANYAEARQSFYEDTVSPLQGRMAEPLEVELLHQDFDSTSQTSVGFDSFEGPALRPARQLVFTNALAGWKEGLFTQNKSFAMIGEEPVPEGDVYLRPSSSTTVPVAKAGDETTVTVQPASVYAPTDGGKPAAGAPAAAAPGAKPVDAKPAVETKAPTRRT